MDKKELLSNVPEFIENDLKIPVLENGNVNKKNVLKVIDMIFDDTLSVNKRLSLLTKFELSIRRMACAFENKFREAENEFRVWKAGENEILSRNDETNPLVRDGYKITENAKKAFLRKKDKYKKYRDRIDKYRYYKNLMWNMKDAVVNLSNHFSEVNSKQKEGER